ncbi:response regulator [Novosphingobium bradum]|uniref:Response regulator n=1 Tax=Novosphingobium bradum TaxID=1737444 RepID=A0ABV7IRT4_9SPHN
MNYFEQGMGIDQAPGSPCVLIMEDEFIVALDLSGMAEDLGFRVDGPFATLAEGTSAVAVHCPDAAILDVQLADGEVFPLADLLMQLGVPIIFHSGHADSGHLLARYPSSRSAGKPCPAEIIAQHLVQATWSGPYGSAMQKSAPRLPI